MRRNPLRPQQTQTLIDQITNDALRNAAMAPTYMAALDITGAALIAVAILVRAGVHHG
jgi:hypothetical protein